MASDADMKPKKKQKEKGRILRWRGVLADASRTVRIMILILLAVCSATLSFTQLGFCGIALGDGTSVYIVVLLLPIALGALLFGTTLGTLVGLIAGTMLYGHAIIMPLDYYELMYVTPLVSIFLMTLCGFLMAIMFAFALRHDPASRAKRIIYIAVVCVIVSAFFTLAFNINAVVLTLCDLFARLMVHAGEDENTARLLANAQTAAGRIGNISLQMWIDAALMVLVCAIGDIVGKKASQTRDAVSLRTIFRAWLSVVLLLAFMMTSCMSFISISIDKLNESVATMNERINYLCIQLVRSSNRSESLFELLEDLNVDTERLDSKFAEDASEVVTMDSLLEGYTENSNATILITSLVDASDPPYGYMYLSNDEGFKQYEDLSSYFNDDVIEAMYSSEQNHGKPMRIVYSPSKSLNQGTDSASNLMPQTQICWLVSVSVNDLYQVTIITPSSEIYAERAPVMAWTTLLFVVLFGVVFLLVSWLVSRVVVRRIDKTNSVLARITSGDLDARVEEGETAEFSSLSNGINETVVTLKGWIAEAETRMDAELSTAKAIQASALPGTFPPYPDIRRFDIYACMNPAKEVGGDFYDFFLIGDDCGSYTGKLGFVIADVSGKGVPAALFMMRAMTEIRNFVGSGMEIGEAVENANIQLCQGNDAQMFVTAWVGVLDYGSGHVDFVNAGHNPPLLWQQGGWRWIREKSGLPLGLFEGLPYEAYSVECGIGDQFLLYTDGVTEAMSVSEELFGEDRLEAIAEENYYKHPRQLIEAVRHGVAEHAKDAEQSDDITILALEVGVPPEIAMLITVPADQKELVRVNEFIHTELDRRHCPVRVQNQLDIAVEELFVNVCRYAYPDDVPENRRVVRVSYSYSADPPSVEVGIADDGIPYNPLAKPDAVTPDDIMDVPIGGLGILMAKKSVDEMTYERLDGSNVVTLLKKW